MRRRTPRSPVPIGLIALAVVVVIVFLGFTKDIPFTTPFEVNATFAVGELDPARLAGADRRRRGRQGQGDQGRRRARDAAVVVLQIDDQGLPLHADATAKIRPRIFLEGNFFVDLKPGSP